jgi:hypothetical protein
MDRSKGELLISRSQMKLRDFDRSFGLSNSHSMKTHSIDSLRERLFTALASATLLLVSTATAQNVGIGVANPQSKLTVNGNVAIGSGFNGVAPANGAGVQGPLFVGGTLSNMTSYPNSGAGTYLFFDPTNGSLYAGTATGTNWDSSNRGSNNGVFGQDNLVNGLRNMVCGGTNSVAGAANVVGGGTNTVSSDSAQNVVAGQSNSITTASSANMIDGFNNTVTNFQSSLVVGRSNSASGINNISGGQGNKNTQTTGSALDNLITGLNNTISDTSYSFIGGQGCTINSNANYSFVGGFN